MKLSVPCTEGILSLFPQTSASSSFSHVDVFLDIDDVKPTDEERQVYDAVESVLDEAEAALISIMCYGEGAVPKVKELGSQKDPELLAAATQALEAGLKKMRCYFAVSQKLKAVIPLLLSQLCEGPLTPDQQLVRNRSLCIQFGRILDFAIKFDCVMLRTTSVNHDISTLNRLCPSSAQRCDNFLRIQYFVATQNHMMATLIEAISDFINSDATEGSNVTSTLVMFVYVCCHMIDRKVNADQTTAMSQDFFSRVIAGALIIFDRVDSKGVFAKGSPIDVKYIVDVLRSNPQTAQDRLSLIRINCKTYSSPATPKSIKSLFERSQAVDITGP